MKRWMFVGGLLVLALAGCENTVESAGAGGSGGAGAEGGGDAGGSQPLGCPAVSFLTFELDGVTELADRHVVLSGVLTEVAPGSWQLDTCPPNADCSADTLHSFTVEVPDVEFHLPTGALVQLTFDYSQSPSRHALLLENLPTWSGMDNPIASDTYPWLYVQALGDGPFDIAETLACASPDFDDYDVYNLVVDGTNVGPGEAKSASFGTAHSFQVTNVDVRSLYDLPWSDAYTVLRTAP